LADDDDFERPLGLAKRRRRGNHLHPALLAAFCAAAFGIAAVTWLDWRGDRLGGEPHAIARLETPARSRPEAAPVTQQIESAAAQSQTQLQATQLQTAQAAQTQAAQTQTAPAAPATIGVESATEVETQSGVKVVRSRGGGPPGALIIDVPQTLGIRLVPAPDRRLVENGRYGPLPRIGPDGSRPADVYARPLVTGLSKENGPRIALVVGGMGLSPALTAAAIANLPPAVTLAFAPYGADLPAAAARAREAGHEIILQVPMEPLDYPQTNPGPHALITSHSAAANLDDLHWLLSRFSGYVGVGNFLGGKFTADDKAMAPILQEIGSRGLFYFDDGSSPRSLAAARAADFNLTAIKADVVVDAVARPEAIDAALKKLEAMARQQGIAIGAASGLPMSLDKLAQFARMAEAHGLVLVPLSAARNIARLSEDTRPREAAR
jgi:polysaccharide deacetylase 2 family uncharacterized protein YibQ